MIRCLKAAAAEEEEVMVSFKKILFPTDFSENAHHALRHALQLADFHKGELIVQHVVSDYFEKHTHWATLFDIHEMQKYMDGYVVNEMSKLSPGSANEIVTRRVISKGKPAEEIAALAEKELVDCVVMGSAKGVTTGKVIRLTNRPVLAISSQLGVRDEVHAGKVQRILVATDFSMHSKKVLQYAFDLKRIFGSALYMLYVVETPKAIEFGIRQGHFTDTIKKMREWADNQLVNLTPDEFIGDPSVIRMVDTGSPSDRIAQVSAEINADLTILGTHEYGSMHTHLLGTTTDRLLNKTSVPVLTLKL
jgi:nucleotide-binding universal stress UspA family protein